MAAHRDDADQPQDVVMAELRHYRRLLHERIAKLPCITAQMYRLEALARVRGSKLATYPPACI
jgi:hypothetical protein